MRELKIHEKEWPSPLRALVIIKKVQLPRPRPRSWRVDPVGGGAVHPLRHQGRKDRFPGDRPPEDDPSKMDVLLWRRRRADQRLHVGGARCRLVPRIVDIDSLAAGNAFELTHPVSDEQVRWW